MNNSDYVLAVGRSSRIWIINDILKIEHVKVTKLRERNLLLFGCLS